MLANITSYFWSSESETPCVDENEKSVKDCDNVPVTTKPCETPTPKASSPTPTEEGDWVMVNKSEMVSEGGLATTRTTSPACFEVLPYTATQGTTNIMEGGAQDWLVTPPSVFTESQNFPLASSPIENLLIEHPSMSVYLPRPSSFSNMSRRGHVMSHSIPCSPSSVNCTTPVLEEDKREDQEQQENSQTNQQEVDDAPNRTPGVGNRAATLLQAIDHLRPQQKAQRRREERRLKHKHLIYGNKVREVASAGNGRSRRCHMMAPEKFSRAVNNRKC